MNGRGPEGSPPPRRASARDFIAVLFRRKWIILGVFFLTTTVTAAIILGQPVYYESTGKVLIKRGFKDNLLQDYQRMLGWEEDLASEVETARSATVIREAQQILDQRRKSEGKPTFTIDPGRAEATVLGESNVLAISYRDRVPAVCVEVTDVLLTAYTEYRKRAYTVPYPAEFFEEEIARVNRELRSLEGQRKDLLSQGGLLEGEADRNHMLSAQQSSRLTVEDLRRDVTQMHTALDEMHAYLRDPERSPDVPFATSTGSGNEIVISDLKSNLLKAQIRYSELSGVYKPDVPEMIRLRQQIEDMRKLLDKEVRNRIRIAEVQLAAKEAQLASAQGNLEETQGRIAMFPGQQERLADLGRRISSLQENYGELTDKAERAKINQATSPSWTLLILSPASRAYAKNTKDYVRIALAPIFSLIVGLGLAFFVDSLDTSVKTPRDAEEALELPVLATLKEQRRR